jgi:glyoxylase-like metal-dependent hydrolase (beta-lactamase superfamily II)
LPGSLSEFSGFLFLFLKFPINQLLTNKMKKITNLIATILILLTSISAFAQSVFKNKDLEITKLEKDMWVIETSDKTTMFLIEGNDKAMLIDTGTKCDKLNEVIRKITTKPLMVVITHMHGDHAGNMDQFGEIYMHAADTVLFKHVKPYAGKIHFVVDGQAIDLGGKILNISSMPAHTPGSIVILDRIAGNCYSGDAFGSGQVWLQLKPFSPIKTYVVSCKKMERLMDEGITKIYCGHYPYVKKAYDKSYITDMRKLAESLLFGTAPEAKPHPQKVSIGCENPMMVTLGQATIVYDPEHLK